ncbi:MAG: hypothetical protein QHJ82_15955, partial [Verrucomicrobiota bacterium]|nr:hypothetical protein [Verrucomicrobiota bacterium]
HAQENRPGPQEPRKIRAKRRFGGEILMEVPVNPSFCPGAMEGSNQQLEQKLLMVIWYNPQQVGSTIDTQTGPVVGLWTKDGEKPELVFLDQAETVERHECLARRLQLSILLKHSLQRPAFSFAVNMHRQKWKMNLRAVLGRKRHFCSDMKMAIRQITIIGQEWRGKGRRRQAGIGAWSQKSGDSKHCNPVKSPVELPNGVVECCCERSPRSIWY